MKLTEEQEAIRNAYVAGEQLVVQAGAGTGKTSTLIALAEALPRKRATYIAFNKSIQLEAAKKFSNNVTARTAHSLAYAKFGRLYAQRLNAPRVTTATAARFLGVSSHDVPTFDGQFKHFNTYQLVRIINETVANFCRSDSEKIEAWHVPLTLGIDPLGERGVPTRGLGHFALAEYVLPFANVAWEDLKKREGKMRFTHDHYLKMYALSKPVIQGDVLFFDECQPEGTMVTTPEGLKAIEELKEGDSVTSYDQKSLRLRSKPSIITSVGTRTINENLVVASTESGKQSKYAMNHICIAKIGGAFVGKHIVYIMQRGQDFRVGVTAGNHGKNGGSSGFAGRLREEKGDRLWAIAAYDKREDALFLENVISVRYEIPQLRFTHSHTKNIRAITTQEKLDNFWKKCGANTVAAIKCLEHYGRKIDYPLSERAFTGSVSQIRNNYLMYTRAIEIRACNLMSGMEVLDADVLQERKDKKHKREDEAWTPITVTKEWYKGTVWSLNVEPDHTYIADGIVTHNCQDANPVIASIVNNQKHLQKIFVGDENQAIMGFTGAVSAMTDFAKVPGVKTLSLSQSFRFGQAVADSANEMLGLLGSAMKLRGFDQIPSRIEDLTSDQAAAVLCRTNAGTLQEIVDVQQSGKKAALVGGIDQIKNFVIAAIDLQERSKTNHPELMMFTSWDELKNYVDKDADGGDLATLVKIVEVNDSTKLLNALNSCVDESRADVTISTAHKAKGREWDSVKIGADFSIVKEDPTTGNRSEMGRPEKMLAYVALTRAEVTLDPGCLMQDVHEIRTMREAEEVTV